MEASRHYWYCYMMVLPLFLIVSGGILNKDVEEMCKKNPLGKMNLILEVRSEEPEPVFPIISADRRNANEYRRVLQQWTLRSQEGILRAIEAMGGKDFEVRPFWIVNNIGLLGCDCNTAGIISRIPGNFTMRLEWVARIPEFVKSEQENEPKVACNAGNEKDFLENIRLINAPQAWAKNFDGRGIIVANIDTGVNKNSEALKDNYSGSYLNAVASPMTVEVSPSDDHGHGTHTMGSMCGRKLNSKAIGVAPGATWIACKGCDGTGGCGETPLTTCGEFVVCPWTTNADGPARGDCRKGAHVISCSWGSLLSVLDGISLGLTSIDYQGVVNRWLKLNRIPVFAIGNQGVNAVACSTTGNPGSYETVIGVGAVDCDNKVASFSSVGPVMNGTKSVTKPDLMGPGVNIVSGSNSSSNGSVTMSGTSMATPHVAGAAACVLSKNNTLNYTAVYNILTTTTFQPPVDLSSYLEVCKDIGNPLVPYPNNVYGYGRINVEKAVDKTVSSP